MSPRHRGLAGACVLALGLGACSAKGESKATEPPSAVEPAAGGGAAGWPDAEKVEGEEPAPAEPGDEVEAMAAIVDAAWLELSALDDARKKAAATAGASDPSAAAARCERIRGLANEICLLSDRMCTLATEHPGQRRYADACARSGQTCAQARQAAERCPAA